MFASVINPGAETDLKEIAAYIEIQAQGFGSIFLAEYDKTVLHIRQFPRTTPLRRNNLRHVLIGRFQVYVVYKIYRDRIYVYRLIHAARKPSCRYKK